MLLRERFCTLISHRYFLLPSLPFHAYIPPKAHTFKVSAEQAEKTRQIEEQEREHKLRLERENQEDLAASKANLALAKALEEQERNDRIQLHKSAEDIEKMVRKEESKHDLEVTKNIQSVDSFSLLC
jgi:hypothetical protein